LKTIIIIDDDPSLRRSLLRVAESAYYTAEGFAGGREFFDWLPSDQAACLVVDVRMDEMTGFEVQERVAVSVVFITGHDDPAARARLANGAAPGAAEAVTAAVAACFGIRRPYPLMPMAPTLVRPPFHREGWGLLRRRSTVGECLLTRATAAFWLALVTPPNTGGARFRKLAGHRDGERGRCRVRR
jgi:CheY-like chemotaxis protein